MQTNVKLAPFRSQFINIQGGLVMKRIAKVLAVVMVALMAVSLAGCAAKPKDDAKKALKVGILLPGAINDKGWNASAYEGLQKAKEKFGVDVSYMENVAPSDMEEVFRRYASQGYDLVLGHGYQFSDAAAKVAKEFPKVKFGILNGNVTAEPNLASYQFTNWQPGYVTGVLAGLITKKNSIGAIGGQKIPVIEDALNAFKDGVLSVNPKAKVVITYVDTWDDVAKGKETALAMIRNGADVTVCDANAVGLGNIQAAKEKGTYAIGFVDDQYSVAPETVVASGIQSNQTMVAFAVEQLVKGQFAAKSYTLGIKEGAEGLSPLYDWENKLPKDVIAKVKQIQQDIIDGKITWTKH